MSETQTCRTVCILAAGSGSRQHFAKGRLHKGLIPLGNQAVVSRIIAQIEDPVEFVIAVGHGADQIREYLRLAHPELAVTFQDVNPYMGPGSGPGTSVLACREHLTAPFLLTAVDTLVSKVPSLVPGRSWVGLAPVEEPERYLTIERAGTRVVGFQERTGLGDTAFVGLAWVADPVTFFGGLVSAAREEECQVTPGLAALAESPAGLWAEEVSWLDTGTDEGFAHARRAFPEEPGAGREAIDVTYLFDDRVIKWFADEEQAARCRIRASVLGSAAPPMIQSTGPWLAYERVSGKPLRDRVDAAMVDEVIDWASSSIWLPQQDPGGVEAAALRLYQDKTLKRLDQYLVARDSGEELDETLVNDVVVPPVSEILPAAVDLVIAALEPAGFHGDFHEGNIIENAGRFTAIDWRSDFGGLLTAGDPAYDLAKFVHTLECPESVMSAGRFRVEPKDGGWCIGNEDTRAREDARVAFWRRCDAEGFDWRAVAILDALVFVGMSPLYDARLGDYLYWLGRWLLGVSIECHTWLEREERFQAACLPFRSRRTSAG